MERRGRGSGRRVEGLEGSEEMRGGICLFGLKGWERRIVVRIEVLRGKR